MTTVQNAKVGNDVPVEEQEPFGFSIVPPGKQFPFIEIDGRKRYIMGKSVGREDRRDAHQWINNTSSEMNAEYDISEYSDDAKALFIEFGELTEVAPGVVARVKK